MANESEDRIYKSRTPRDPAEIPLKPFHEIFFKDVEELLEKNGNFVCLELVDAQQKQILLSDFLSMPRRIASGLSRLGFKKGDILCSFINNHLEYYMITLAVWMCGGCTTMVVPSDTPDDLQRQLTDCGSKWLLVDTDTASNAKAALVRLPECTSKWQGHLFIVGGDDPVPKITPSAVPVEDLLNDNGDGCPTNGEIDVKNDIVFLPYSSGTTGLPKGVKHTHYSLTASYLQTKTATRPREGGSSLRLLATVGMYHVTGTILPFIFIPKGFWVGLFGKLEDIDDKILPCVSKYKPQTIFILPQQMVMLANIPDPDQYDTSSLKSITAGGAHIHSKFMKQVAEKFKVHAVTNYGSTETMGVLTTPLTPLGPASAQGNNGNNIGTLRAFTEAKIVHPDSRVALGTLQEGEIAFKSPALAKGYLNKPEETAQSFSDGWYFTGDLGYVDDNGSLYFVERLKEILKYKNIQVPPAQLESILTQHPDVKDAVVIGIPDPEHGDLPRAYVALKDGTTITADELRKLVDDNVADYKHLRGGVKIVDSIPRNSYGKPKRRELLQAALNECS